MSDERLIITFIPSLVSVRLERETEKGSPLTEQEVLAIRDNAAVVALPVESAVAVEDSRGYRDLDPANCWEEWQQARRALVGHEKGKA